MIQPTHWTLAATVGLCALTSAALARDPVAAYQTALGPNIYVFDLSMPATEAPRTAAVFTQMEANQFGPERYALLFNPDASDDTFNVGFYTQVAGLGGAPTTC